MEAFALCWSNDPIPLLYLSARAVEEDRKFFTANYKKNRQGHDRGAPYVIRLVPERDPAKPHTIDDADEFAKACACTALEHWLGTPFEPELRLAWEAGRYDRKHATNE